jgi:CDP-diacylglycerol--glycerol-3-phosphate 3-phosphatidyltransferase/cardiolipin synthase
MVALGALILAGGLPDWNMELAGRQMNVPLTVGLYSLWAAAILTLITGWDYLRVGLKHMD